VEASQHADVDAVSASVSSAPGFYFTDGTHLYRLVGVVRPPDAPVLMEFEDCLELVCVFLNREELAASKLRPVVTAAD
jgi:hypothetical protein